jgi:hypothetical protein
VASCASLPFCEDFESGTAGQAPPSPKWTVVMNGNGTARIDGAQGHGSSKSLRVNNTGYHISAMVSGAPLFPLPSGALWGRYYFRLAAVPTSGHHIWVEAGSIANDGRETRLGANAINGMLRLDINRWPGDTEQTSPMGTLVAGRWHCMEFMFDSTAHEARVWFDSAELPDLRVTNWVPPLNPMNGNNSSPIPNWSPVYEAIRFGMELAQGEIWYDDIALGYARIGCLP